MKANREPGMVIDRGHHTATNILMIRIRKFYEGEKAHHTKEVVDGGVVDFDENNQPIQIEVLNPTKHFPEAILALLPPEFIPEENLSEGYGKLTNE